VSIIISIHYTVIVASLIFGISFWVQLYSSYVWSFMKVGPKMDPK